MSDDVKQSATLTFTGEDGEPVTIDCEVIESTLTIPEGDTSGVSFGRQAVEVREGVVVTRPKGWSENG